MAAFTDYRALDFSGLDKSINGIVERRSLANLGQGLDGSPEGYAKAAQALLAKGDIANAGTFLALGEKARERTGQADASKGFLGALGAAPTAPASPTARPIAALGQPNEIEDKFVGTVKQAGLTNPVGLGAVAAYGKAESGFQPQNVNRSWSDPSESGQAGTAGGIMSWRAERLQGLQNFAKERGEAQPSVETQALYLSKEDPSLIPKLQAAKTPQEANQIMANAWRFAGYNREGGENARRLALTQSYAQRYGGQGGGAPAVPVQVAENEADVQRLEAQQGNPIIQGAPVVAQGQQPGGGGTYANVPEPVLNGFLNNPKVPENFKVMMRQELASRQPAQSPVQVAEAAPQPGIPIADMPSSAAAPVTGPGTTQAAQAQGFAIPGTSLPPNDPHPSVPNSVFTQAILNPRLPADQKAYAQRVLDSRQKYSDENAPDKREAIQLQNEKTRRELQGKGFRTLTSDERAAAGVDPSFKGVVQIDRDGQLHFPGKASTEVNVKNEGTIPAGYRMLRDAQGNPTQLEPIPGSPAAAEAAGADKKAEAQRQQTEQTGNVVINSLNDVDRLMKEATLPTTGALGSRAAEIKGTAAHDIKNALTTIGANISFQNLAQMRAASPTGGALGAVSDSEQKMLQNAWGALEQSQSEGQFKTNLGRVRAIFERTVHGRVLTPQERKSGGPMTGERAKGLRDEAAAAIAGGAPKDAVLQRLKDQYGIDGGGL
jgi:hypothetical protein